MDKKNKRPLILLLGNYRPSLIIARTFKERGFEVVVGTHGCERLCQYSNAVSSMWEHSPLNSGAQILAKELKAYVSQNPELIAIFPVAEEYARLIAEHEDSFDNLPKIVSMDSKLILSCLDKEYMLNLAKSVGVSIVPFAYTSGLVETLQVSNATVKFPMIIRPKDSTRRLGGDKAISVENEDALVSSFNDLHLEKQDLLIQRKFTGKRHNIYFAAVNGKATRLLHAVIDRTDKLDDTGLAVEGRTLSTDHDLVIQTGKLLKALDYNGIGCAQFLVNEITGETSFLEINPRIAGNHALPEYVGLDLAWFNFERVVHNRISQRKIMSAGGMQYCWSTGDIMGAKVAFLRKEIGVTGFLRWLGKAFMNIIRSDLHIVFDIKDPLPAIMAIWNFVPRIARWRQPTISSGESTIYSSETRSSK